MNSPAGGKARVAGIRPVSLLWNKVWGKRLVLSLGLQSYLLLKVGLGARGPGGSSHTEPEEVRPEP